MRIGKTHGALSFGLALILLLTSCGGGGGGGGDSPAKAAAAPPPPSPPAQNNAFGLSSRPATASLNFPSQTTSGSVMLQNVASGFTYPVFFTAIPNSGGRGAVVEQAGRIRVLRPDFTVESTLLDISPQVVFSGEQGLLGLAFDPQVSSNGYFYISYVSQKTGGRCATASNNTCTRILRFQLNGSPGSFQYTQVAATSGQIVLEISQPYDTHKSGMLLFGPDDKLYIGVGDGGDYGGPQGNGQNRATLLGKILRIDPTGGTPYAVPADNPFVGNTQGWRPEIWAFGFRNPWRFSFDRQGNTLWAGDVGQDTWEEVDIVTRGGNYGWGAREGKHPFNGAAAPPDAIDPVWEYKHTDGIAITGGYVYRGNAAPALQGQYIYSDYGAGTLWALDPATFTNKTVLTNTTGMQVSSFGEDEAGELYVVDYFGGALLRVASASADGEAMPTSLSATGLFTSLAPLQAATGLIEYDVNTPLWSDGAVKRRWIALPEGGQITFAADGAWQLPVGSVVVKNFAMAMDQASPSVLRNLETRVLIHQNSGWVGYTYRWNDAQTDATLLDSAQSETLSMRDANGVAFTQQYDYPSPSQCHSCHTAQAGPLLGLRTRQLNRNFNYVDANGQTVSDNQLRAFNHVALFNTDIGGTDQYGASASLDNSSVNIGQRARDYLDANCSQCHQPGGPTGASIDLRASVAIDAMNVVNATPSAGDLGISGARIIAPGSKEHSVLWQRLQITSAGAGRMPPLGTHAVDQAAVNLIGQWIDSLPH